MNYKYLFFDLDGTLTDSGAAITSCAKYALDQLGYKNEPDDKLKRFVGPSLKDSFEKLYGITGEENDRGIKLFRSLYVQGGRMYDVTVYPGIPELLDKCQKAGLVSFVVTSKVTAFAEKIIAKVGLSDCFKGIIGPAPDDFSSDKSRLINRAVADYSLDKKTCVMIGDTRFDIEGAHKARIDSIAVTYGYGDPAEVQMAHPTHYAADAADLADILL